ncbi:MULTISPECIES: autotransporter outer membrane beta-barrel domain-containing protein [unclassified Pseudomonas]|uniref:autotransporter domain-containing protein n=1 Tax=unclassified Pseudomonas TaxID=196821 RepID=UPI001A9FAC5A|nr:MULTISPECIES: autotransporter outer membrane beta-barrel domain-containing protein [unclassified Pseudomonas]MDP4572848.1 autotransporter outer membrane beta-barrel domain-containing protein [Pseudomonas sp. LPH60]
MNTSLTSSPLPFALCSLYTSLLLCSMEVAASPGEDTDNTGYPPTLSSLPISASPLGSPRPSDFAVLDRPGLPTHLEVGYLALPGAGGEPRKGPLLYSIQNNGTTQQIGLLSTPNTYTLTQGGAPSTVNDPRNAGLSVQGQGLGAFWRLQGAEGWHLDMSASGGRVSGFSRNEQGRGMTTEGNAMTFSVQGGVAIGLSDNWVIEPQAQVINQRIRLDGGNSSNDLNAWSGRVGARLQGRYDVHGLPLEPYVRTNLWHTVYSGETLSLDQVDKISSSRKSSTVEVGLGLVARVTPAVSLYVSADYSSDVDDNDLNGLIGSLGVRMRW